MNLNICVGGWGQNKDKGSCKGGANKESGEEGQENAIKNKGQKREPVQKRGGVGRL